MSEKGGLETAFPKRLYPHEPDRYGYGGRPEDCPKCGAVSRDYCPLWQCEWDDTNPLPQMNMQ